MTSRSANCAFTMIELLVVISIIAVLASMLLPAIMMVRNAANTAHCASNLRQIGMGCVGYSSDWDGFMVPSYTLLFPSDRSKDQRLSWLLHDYVSTDANGAFATRVDVWSCKARTLTPTERPMDYGGNINIHRYWHPEANPLAYPKRLKLITVTQVRRASTTVAIADTAQASGPAGVVAGYIDYSDHIAFDVPADADKRIDEWGVYQAQLATGYPDSPPACYMPRWRHNGDKIMNILWADGHVSGERRDAVLYRHFSQAY